MVGSTLKARHCYRIHPSSFISDWSVKSACPVVSVLPVVTSNIRTDRHADETTRCPSGENATDVTGDMCPVNGPAQSLPSWCSAHKLLHRKSLRRCADHLARMPQTRTNFCIQ